MASTICNGGSQTYTVSGALSYTWTPAATLTGANSANPVASPTTTTTYTVVGTDGNSCSNVLGHDTVTLYVTPPPTLSLAANSYTICNGASQTFTATGAGTYVWNPLTNISGANTATPTVSPSSSQVYTVTGTTSGCIASPPLTVSLTVNATPTITIAPLGSNSVICNGGSTVITPTGANTYTLNPGNLMGTSFTLSPTSSITYTINGTNSSTTGCSNFASNAGLASITVNATPTITIAPLGSNSVICNGGSTVITPIGASTYTLNPGNLTGTSFTLSPSSSVTYTINGSNSATSGCTNFNSNAGLASITVNATPTITVTGATLDTAKCGQPTGGVILNNTNVSGGLLPYQYQWYNSSGTLISTSSSFGSQPAGNYNLVVTDANNCKSNGSGSVTTFTVPASTGIHAVFSTNPSPATGTIPLNITFTNTSVGATTYNWSFGDVSNATSTATNPSFTYTNTGTYTVTLVAVNGLCSDIAYAVIIADVPTTIVIPNIFSPNGDGINDQFFIINTGMTTLNCDIFNRWGELLYTITAPDQFWDGRVPNGDQAPDGTYMYILQAQGLNGKTFKQQGTVTLVR